MSSTVSPATIDRPNHPAGGGPAPHEIVWQLTNAVVPSACLHLIAELGVADHIAAEPVPAAELARLTSTSAQALDRVLRLLATLGVFARGEAGYVHTPASRLLRSDDPSSMRGFPRMMGLPLISAVFANLAHSVRTGAPAVETVEPGGFWAYLDDHPDEARIFGQAMTAKAAADIGTVLAAHDFGGYETVVDVGGGRGHLIHAILESAPATRGVLFDLPGVIDGLDIRHDRLDARAGDFFRDPLPPADAYVLMEILHDWPDEECVAILRAVRDQAKPGADVLVIETVLDEQTSDPRARILDVIMLAVTGGRERTSVELDRLFTGAGLRPGRVVETGGPLRIVQASAP